MKELAIIIWGILMHTVTICACLFIVLAAIRYLDLYLSDKTLAIGWLVVLLLAVIAFLSARSILSLLS